MASATVSRSSSFSSTTSSAPLSRRSSMASTSAAPVVRNGFVIPAITLTPPDDKPRRSEPLPWQDFTSKKSLYVPVKTEDIGWEEGGLWWHGKFHYREVLLYGGEDDRVVGKYRGGPEGYSYSEIWDEDGFKHQPPRKNQEPAPQKSSSSRRRSSSSSSKTADRRSERASSSASSRASSDSAPSSVASASASTLSSASKSAISPSTDIDDRQRSDAPAATASVAADATQTAATRASAAQHVGVSAPQHGDHADASKSHNAAAASAQVQHDAATEVSQPQPQPQTAELASASSTTATIQSPPLSRRNSDASFVSHGSFSDSASSSRRASDSSTDTAMTTPCDSPIDRLSFSSAFGKDVECPGLLMDSPIDGAAPFQKLEAALLALKAEEAAGTRTDAGDIEESDAAQEQPTPSQQPLRQGGSITLSADGPSASHRWPKGRGVAKIAETPSSAPKLRSQQQAAWRHVPGGGASAPARPSTLSSAGSKRLGSPLAAMAPRRMSSTPVVFEDEQELGYSC